jgi:L-ascorbate metabolism protein UlaG (beta-lactamase superfamily)
MTAEISCTYIGHATTVIQIGASTIITDPVFSEKILFLKRQKPLPMPPQDIPSPDVVLISHIHFDHLDISSFKFISCQVPIIVPEGCERAVGRYLPNPVIELAAFAGYELKDGTKITAMPSIHRSFRVLPFNFKTTNSYLLKSPDLEKQILFVGDSAYGTHFSQIGELGKIGVAVIPIGAYEPSFIMKSRHMTPKEAVQAFKDLGAEHMIASHHGVFRLSLENLKAPAARLEKNISERPDLRERIHIPDPGDKFSLT